MLKIYDVMLEALDDVKPLLARVELKDSDLARQMRRAAASVVLNLGEGMSRGKNRQARYHSALGSARETMACLQVGERLYGLAPGEPVMDRLDRVVATLVKLV